MTAILPETVFKTIENGAYDARKANGVLHPKRHFRRPLRWRFSKRGKPGTKRKQGCPGVLRCTAGAPALGICAIYGNGK